MAGKVNHARFLVLDALIDEGVKLEVSLEEGYYVVGLYYENYQGVSVESDVYGSGPSFIRGLDAALLELWKDFDLEYDALTYDYGPGGSDLTPIEIFGDESQASIWITLAKHFRRK